jgi:hypothetical protein
VSRNFEDDYRDLDLNVYADRDTDLESQLSVENLNWKPVPANLRSCEDYLDSSAELVRRPFNKRASNLILVGDQEMKELESFIRVLIERKTTLLHGLINGKVQMSEKLSMKRYLNIWKNITLEMRMNILNFHSTKIQAMARVWLCRVTLIFMKL